MDPSQFISARAGHVVTVQTGTDGYAAFYPTMLPPSPPIKFDDDLAQLIDAANHSLGKLDGVTVALPDPDALLYAFIRKEAVLSSQIEGTQSSISELLLFENDAAPGVAAEDVRQTANYLNAIHDGIAVVRQGRLPISSRLLRELHARLVMNTRGADKQPGEFRTSQNWIGGTMPGNAIFVPPPHHEVANCIANLERYIHDDASRARPLITAAIAHAQFESIHPFLDGNGRIGRLLITLILCDQGVLERPMLYLSLFFKENRDEYYRLLQRVRTHGDYESWLKFFMRGVAEVSTSVTRATKQLIDLIAADRVRVNALGRGALSALRVLEVLSRDLAIRGPATAKELALSEPTVNGAIRSLERLGIAKEATGNSRNRVFTYPSYLRILSEGTVPLAI